MPRQSPACEIRGRARCGGNNVTRIWTTGIRNTRLPQRLLQCLILLGLLSGCAGTPPAGSDTEASTPGTTTPATAPPDPHNQVTYQGTLPCPDCEGLQVTLVLDHDAYTYRTTERRLGEQSNAEPDRSSGPWAVRYGTESDPDAVIYQLDHDRPGSTRNFLRLDAARIKLLDEFKREFWSPFNLILERTE